jgi:hypothetical protein
VKRIPLTRGLFALVDDEDFERVNRFKWYASEDAGRWYAIRRVRIGPKKTRGISLHRFLMSTPDGLETDHINGDRLDNRKQNLRVCTRLENSRNCGKRRPNGTATSDFVGVFRQTRSANRPKPWRSKIRVDGHDMYLGWFDTDSAAARAYDEAAKKHFGEFARLNFPES